MESKQDASARFRWLLRAARDAEGGWGRTGRFGLVEDPGGAKQTQQDALEFLEAVLQAEREREREGKREREGRKRERRRKATEHARLNRAS